MALAQFTCPTCGAQTAYEPGTTMLRCSRCGAEERIDAAGRTIVEHSYDDWAALPPKPVATIGTQVLQCQNCGATIETDMLADTCRFCRGPLVAVQNPDRLIAPEAVVPFGLNQAAANGAFNTWVRSRRFAPGALKRMGSTDSITGTYIPHWTYDAQTGTDYVGQRGEYYYVSVPVTVSDGRGHTRTEFRQERRTRWYDAAGHVTRPFDDVLVPASHRLPIETLQKMGPWTLPSAAPYQPEYLAGYAALRYDVDPDTGLAVAREEMADVISGDCHRRRHPARRSPEHQLHRDDVQARPAAAVDRVLPLRGDDVPGARQRQHRRGARRPSVQQDQDRGGDPGRAARGRRDRHPDRAEQTSLSRDALRRSRC
jgi:Zn finger protein HypA/HybF involved in hydrogenase expression